VYQKQPIVKLQGGGYFTAFEYTPIDYEHARLAAAKDHQEHTKMQQLISNEQFKPLKNIKKMKYEDPFNFSEEKREYQIRDH
jgi:hypothetical protein